MNLKIDKNKSNFINNNKQKNYKKKKFYHKIFIKYNNRTKV